MWYGPLYFPRFLCLLGKQTKARFMMNPVKFTTVAEYIATFPPATRALLKQMRAIVKKASPKSTDVISYNMPAVRIHRVIVYYAAYKAHLGFYPTGSGVAKFAKELAAYPTSKGAIRLPLNKPLPAALITKIVKFRVAEDENRARMKALMK